MPFRAHLRSRKSLLVGVTRLSSRKRDPYDSGFWGDDDHVVFPHAGVSLQWPMGRHADFRFDAQGLFTLDGELPLVPRAVANLRLAPGRRPMKALVAVRCDPRRPSRARLWRLGAGGARHRPARAAAARDRRHRRRDLAHPHRRYPRFHAGFGPDVRRRRRQRDAAPPDRAGTATGAVRNGTF